MTTSTNIIAEPKVGRLGLGPALGTAAARRGTATGSRVCSGCKGRLLSWMPANYEAYGLRSRWDRAACFTCIGTITHLRSGRRTDRRLKTKIDRGLLWSVG